MTKCPGSNQLGGSENVTIGVRITEMAAAKPILMRWGTIRPPSKGKADKITAVRTKTTRNCQTC